MAGKKKTEPRRLRVYKATDVCYDMAMKQAKKDKIKLTQLIEKILIAYSNNCIISTRERIKGEKQLDVSLVIKKKNQPVP